MTEQKLAHPTYATDEEVEAYHKLLELSRRSPVLEREVLGNLGLFLVRASFARMLFMHHLYLKILNTHGVIMEFGVRWGQNMALFTTFRNLHEPYNLSRKVIGFDTFEGYTRIAPEDGTSHWLRKGGLTVPPDYQAYLDEILSAHEKLGPRSHVKKYELITGDVTETLPVYLKEHPETIISLAYFDLNLYEPTKKCLELIRPHLVKNSIVGFDELLVDVVPGETQALKDTWGLSDFEIVRLPECPQQSYLVLR